MEKLILGRSPESNAVYDGKSDFDQNRFEQKTPKRDFCKSLNFNYIEIDGTEFDVFVASVRPEKHQRSHTRRRIFITLYPTCLVLENVPQVVD